MKKIYPIYGRAGSRKSPKRKDFQLPSDGISWQTAVALNYRSEQNTNENMSFKITGIVEVVMPETIVSNKFRFREIVIVKSGQYPQSIIFQFRNDHADLLSGITKGSEVTVSFEVAGKLHENEKGKRYFNTLVGCDISKS